MQLCNISDLFPFLLKEGQGEGLLIQTTEKPAIQRAGPMITARSIGQSRRATVKAHDQGLVQPRRVLKTADDDFSVLLQRQASQD